MLSFAEEGSHVPFTPVRYFVLYDVPDGHTRGDHAHREAHQFLVALRGSCMLEVDDGRTKAELRLDTPALGVHAPPLTWCTLRDFSSDALVLVLTSHRYDAADYIRVYSEFGRITAAS
jgi:hypothetical protein